MCGEHPGFCPEPDLEHVVACFWTPRTAASTPCSAWRRRSPSPAGLSRPVAPCLGPRESSDRAAPAVARRTVGSPRPRFWRRAASKGRQVPLRCSTSQSPGVCVGQTRRSGNGGGGIRTRGPLARTPVFKTGAFDHSATPPGRHGLDPSRVRPGLAGRLSPIGRASCRPGAPIHWPNSRRRGGRVAEGTRLLSE